MSPSDRGKLFLEKIDGRMDLFDRRAFDEILVTVIKFCLVNRCWYRSQEGHSFRVMPGSPESIKG